MVGYLAQFKRQQSRSGLLYWRALLASSIHNALEMITETREVVKGRAFPRNVRIVLSGKMHVIKKRKRGKEVKRRSLKNQQIGRHEKREDIGPQEG